MIKNVGNTENSIIPLWDVEKKIDFLMKNRFKKRNFKKEFYASSSIFMSSSTLAIPEIPKLLTNTLATLGERNAGSVGPR